MNYNNIIQKINALYKQKNLSLNKLAELIGKNPSSLHYAFNKGRLDLETFLRICEALEVDPCDVMECGAKSLDEDKNFLENYIYYWLIHTVLTDKSQKYIISPSFYIVLLTYAVLTEDFSMLNFTNVPKFREFIKESDIEEFKILRLALDDNLNLKEKKELIRAKLNEYFSKSLRNDIIRIIVGAANLKTEDIDEFVEGVEKEINLNEKEKEQLKKEIDNVRKRLLKFNDIINHNPEKNENE